MTDSDKQIEFLLARIEELRDELETLHADYLTLFWETKGGLTCDGMCGCKNNSGLPEEDPDLYQGA